MTVVPTAIAKDRVRWPDGSNVVGQTLFDDDFASGLSVWRDHMSAAIPRAPISLSTLRSWEGSPYSMMLSTSPRRNNGIVAAATCGAYRNLSRDVDTGKIRFEAWVALSSGLQNSADTANTPNSFFIGMDSQSWDNSHRGFPKLTCLVRTGSDSTSVLTYAWGITADDGSTVYIDGATGLGVPAVPAIQPPAPGANENKLNFFRVALWYDLSALRSSDGKPGSYFRAEMGPKTFDLTGYRDASNAPVGRGKQTPQTTSSVGGGGFNGGLNFGFGLTNRSATDVAYPPFMLVGRTRATWYPNGVAV